MHVLALVTDAFGGRGGIARYNRDFLSALVKADVVDQIIVAPRLSPDPAGFLPDKIEQLAPIYNPVSYSVSSVRRALQGTKPDVIFCGHVLMSPLAASLASALRVPMWLQVHGIDAWNSPSRAVKWSAERSALVTSVSRYTKAQLARWWNGDPARIRVLPNTVRPQFSPGAKPLALLDRYGLHGKRVILTVSRLSQADRYKGLDRIIAAMPVIAGARPDVVFLIAGDGDDATRLQQLAVAHGVGDRVQFAGYVPEAELADHFRVADVYAMPSTKEGFGIVFIEAALCGLPVIGGNRDGSVDALADGRIGRLIDPESNEELVSAIFDALSYRAAAHPEQANRFAYQNFTQHVGHLVRSLAR
ncbi:MAG: glycosyltransferase family 4 protein [Hyphomicrobiaceae bacterium]